MAEISKEGGGRRRSNTTHALIHHPSSPGRGQNRQAGAVADGDAATPRPARPRDPARPGLPDGAPQPVSQATHTSQSPPKLANERNERKKTGGVRSTRCTTTTAPQALATKPKPRGRENFAETPLREPASAQPPTGGQRYIRQPPSRRRCAKHLAFCTLGVFALALSLPRLALPCSAYVYTARERRRSKTE